MNRARTTVLFGLGLGLAFQIAPAAAWMQWYSQSIPYAPVPGMWFYQSIPTVPSFGPGQPWLWYYQALPAGRRVPQLRQNRSIPFGSTTMWSSTMSTSGLSVERSETPAGYMIRVRTAQVGVPAVDISVQGGFLTIRSRSMTGAGGGVPMQQAGWTTQWISLPADANVAATQMQRGGGVVEIFIPRGL